MALKFGGSFGLDASAPPRREFFGGFGTEDFSVKLVPCKKLLQPRKLTLESALGFIKGADAMMRRGSAKEAWFLKKCPCGEADVFVTQDSFVDMAGALLSLGTMLQDRMFKKGGRGPEVKKDVGEK